MKLVIGHLYPLYMNTYGDDGNIITLKKRCAWRGIEVEIKEIPLLPRKSELVADLYFFGGGQDQAQSLISKDLIKNSGPTVKKRVEEGVPLLAICGGYQLLGEYYKPAGEEKIKGVGVFPVYTEASNTRMIGNLVVDSEIAGKLVGFENHSGKTFLRKNAKALGKVIKGFGNNGEDKLEGCIFKNAIGCYLHGSLLPKNPKLADWLIKKALEVKYGKKINLKPLNDNLEQSAHQKAIELFS